MIFPKKKQKSKTNRATVIKRCSILWSKKVKAVTNGRCAVCGSTSGVQSHHIVRKSTRMHRGWFDLDNGIPLCFQCHYSGIHSLHFPTTKIFQYKIEQYIKRKGITYDALYQKCQGRVDVAYLEEVAFSLAK